MVQRKYNWPAMVRDIMDAKFLSQQEFADTLRVGQQSVSAWLNGHRFPRRSTAIPRLLKFARRNGIDLEKYESDSSRSTLLEYLDMGDGRELATLLELYVRMDKADRRKFIRYAEKV